MTIHRVTSVWQGFTGAPGYTNFFFAGSAALDGVASNFAVREFFSAISDYLPSDVTVETEGEMADFDEETGSLEGYHNPEHEGAMLSSGDSSGTYSAAAGAVVNWLTDTVNRARRVQGRTFLVPIGNLGLQSDGTISSMALDTIRSAARELALESSGPGMVVWSRPRNGSGGAMAPITGIRVPDMTAVLRSRRD